MFALLFACERATDNVALEADKVASRHGEELEPADKDDGGEEEISGIQMSPMTEACASALQMNFEQFYAAWDPKWGTPEVDVADLIMQVQKLKSKQASEAPKVEAVDAPARRAPRESSEDEFLTEFMRTPPASPATAAAISAAIAEVEQEARLAKVAEEPESDLAKVAEAFKLEDADLEKVWVAVLEKPSGTACEAGVRVRVPDGRSHALQVQEILEGPIKAWNKANPENAINVGDEIVEVNGQMGSGTLLRERLREDAERRVLVQRRRSEPARPTPAKKPARSWSFRLPKWRFRRSA